MRNKYPFDQRKKQYRHILDDSNPQTQAKKLKEFIEEEESTFKDRHGRPRETLFLLMARDSLSELSNYLSTDDEPTANRRRP